MNHPTNAAMTGMRENVFQSARNVVMPFMTNRDTPKAIGIIIGTAALVTGVTNGTADAKRVLVIVVTRVVGLVCTCWCWQCLFLLALKQPTKLVGTCTRRTTGVKASAAFGAQAKTNASNNNSETIGLEWYL